MNTLYGMGMSVSYDRVLEIENSLATAVCKRFEEENLVCPANFRKGLTTISALDNLDHNPSATSAQGSFHGTGISIFQLPSHTYSGIVRDPIVIDWSSLRVSGALASGHNKTSQHQRDLVGHNMTRVGNQYGRSFLRLRGLVKSS